MADMEKKKNSFRDMILIIFVVLICFGLTIYGIVYLTGKVFSSEEKIEIAKIRAPAVTTDPEEGDILTFSSRPETSLKEAESAAAIPPAEPEGKEAGQVREKPAPVRMQQYSAEKRPSEPAPAEPAGTERSRHAPAEKPAARQVAPAPKPQNTAKQAAPAKPAASAKSAAAAKEVKGAYVVQIMALTSIKDAEKEAARFKNSCPDVFVQKADLGSKGVWYRVRCGATNSKEQASHTREMLSSRYKGISPQVVGNR